MLDKSIIYSSTATVEICLRKIIKTFNICENKSTLNCSKICTLKNKSTQNLSRQN